MKHILYIVFSVMISGCATSLDAPSFSTAPVPDLSSGKAVLYIYRENAQPTAWSAYLQIDEQEAASLAQEGFTWVYIAAGKHNFKFGWPLFVGMPSVTFERTFEAGKVYAFEMRGSVRAGGSTITSTSVIQTITSTSAIQPTSIDAAKEKMATCCRYVAPKQTEFLQKN
jgi:hypothetical protein